MRHAPLLRWLRALLTACARRSFLDLKRDSMQEVASRVGVSVEELTKRVEDLTRLH